MYKKFMGYLHSNMSLLQWEDQMDVKDISQSFKMVIDFAVFLIAWMWNTDKPSVRFFILPFCQFFPIPFL